MLMLFHGMVGMAHGRGLSMTGGCIQFVVRPHVVMLLMLLV
jgi:hypothetical protein